MANPVSMDDLQKSLSSIDDLIARDVLLPLGPDEIIVTDVMAWAAVGRRGARKLIDKWVREGELEYVGKRRNHSQPTDAWKRKVKDTHEQASG